MSSQIPVFMVNLSRSADRRSRMKTLLDSKEIAYRLFPAVDGAQLDAKEVQKTIDASVFMKRLRGLPLTRGEIGCALSHLNLYKKIVDENIECACIIEDDIDITDEDAFRHLLDMEYSKNDTRWDILLLGHIQQVEHSDSALLSFRKYSVYKGVSFAVPVQFCYSTTGYMIRKAAAEKLLSHGFPVRVPADFLTGDSAKFGIRLMAVSPKIVVPNREYFENEKSLIADRRTGVKTAKNKRAVFSILKQMLYSFLIFARRAGFLRKKSYFDY
jgi:glycosyl transferase, family 25